MPSILPCDDAPHGLLSDKLQNKVSGQTGIVVAEERDTVLWSISSWTVVVEIYKVEARNMTLVTR